MLSILWLVFKEFYNVGGIPRILLNAEPLPDRETINKGLPDFEGVDECRRVIFRHVPGNGENFIFFHIQITKLALVHPNAKNLEIHFLQISSLN